MGRYTQETLTYLSTLSRNAIGPRWADKVFSFYSMILELLDIGSTYLYGRRMQRHFARLRCMTAD